MHPDQALRTWSDGPARIKTIPKNTVVYNSFI